MWREKASATHMTELNVFFSFNINGNNLYVHLYACQFIYAIKASILNLCQIDA